jgi:hypothetical protein
MMILSDAPLFAPELQPVSIATPKATATTTKIALLLVIMIALLKL